MNRHVYGGVLTWAQNKKKNKTSVIINTRTHVDNDSEVEEAVAKVYLRAHKLCSKCVAHAVTCTIEAMMNIIKQTFFLLSLINYDV